MYIPKSCNYRKYYILFLRRGDITGQQFLSCFEESIFNSRGWNCVTQFLRTRV